MEISAEIQKYRQEIKSERMDMSFGEIINMYRDKEIIISPEYQRAFRGMNRDNQILLNRYCWEYHFRQFLLQPIQTENGN